jgi:hypothetical protein
VVGLVVVASLAAVARNYDGSIQDWRTPISVLVERVTPRDGVVVCGSRRGDVGQCGFALDGRERTFSREFRGIHVERYDRA